MIAETIAYQPKVVDLKPGQIRDTQLSCVKTGILEDRYEIRSTDRRVAALRLRGLFRPSISAEADDGAWFFEPLDRSIVVRSMDTLRELATVDMSFSDHGGIVRFRDGRALIFSSDFWKGLAEFQTPSGDPVVRFQFHGLFRPSADIEILERGKQLPELSWLLMLGWSLIVGYL